MEGEFLSVLQAAELEGWNERKVSRAFVFNFNLNSGEIKKLGKSGRGAPRRKRYITREGLRLYHEHCKRVVGINYELPPDWLQKGCAQCLVIKKREEFERPDSIHGGAHRCNKCYARRKRNRYQFKRRNNRQIILDALGRICVCCGETEEGFLTVEHKLRDGAKHRLKFGKEIYRAIIREGIPKERYEILCMNCNWASGRLGICPHRGK